MYPTDPSDSHLKDRAVEFRIIKSAVVVFLVTLAAVFYPWVPVLMVFALGYVVYKFRYYTNRVGVYTNDDLSARYDRLEYGLAGFALVTVATLLVIEIAFFETWVLGGILSLPAVDFTNLDALVQEPIVPLAYVVVITPALAATVLGIQFRKRLLVGIDSTVGAVRATIWDSLAQIPIALLWVAVLNMRPVFEVWQPVVDIIGTELGLVPDVAIGFAVILGSVFEPVLGACIALPAVVISSYLTVQRFKYHDGTVPEVLGYRGFFSPSRESTPLNVAVPTAVFLLYALAVFTVVGSVPLGEEQLLVAVALSVLIGANLFGLTTATVSMVSQRIGDTLGAVVIGFVVGLLGLFGAGPFVGSGASLTDMAITYPVAAVPASYAGNRLAGLYAIRNISALVDRVETGREFPDQGTIDRLFVYTRTRDDRLRATAVDGLSAAASTTAYRKEDTLDVFEEAIKSNDHNTVHAGLRGISTILGYDRSQWAYNRLAAGDVPETINSYLDSERETTHVLAAGTAAQMRTLELTVADPPDQLDEPRIRTVGDIVERNPQNQWLTDAVIEYFATLWTVTAQADQRAGTDPARQYLLGSLIWLSNYGTDTARLRVVFAVTGDRAVADSDRVDLAIDHLDSERDETRYLAAHVIRSSLDRHTDRIPTDEISALLDDPSDAVRWMAAETIGTLVRFDPETGSQLLDRMVLYLEENHQDPGRTERAVIRAVSDIDTGQLLDHPTMSETIATYVASTELVARPAARLLASLVENSPGISAEEPVSAAIESGLTHDSETVRLACLEAVAAIVDDSTPNARQFVDGLGENIATTGRHGVLAAVSLEKILETYPEEGLEILPNLAAGLRNRTPVDNQSIPFLIRESTVGTVTVSTVEEVVSLDPSRCEVVIEPLVELASTADRATSSVIFRVLSELSGEHPTESRAAVEAAASQLDAGRMSIRRDAAQVLANVGAYHPETVAPSVDPLVIATDDTSPRVRSPALLALQNVCTAVPEVIESDIHRIIGLLDDDSAIVRKNAADLISTVADRKPEIVDPAAETADRLRRLQRDPAVDVDPDRLQDASTAIQTGVAAKETESGSPEKEDLWSPETSEEMGISGETEVFEPVGDDFDPDFEEPFEEDEATEDQVDAPPDSVGEHETVIESSESTAETDDIEDQAALDAADRDTVIDSSEPTAEPDDSTESPAVDTEDRKTVIEHDEEVSQTDDTEEQLGDGS